MITLACCRWSQHPPPGWQQSAGRQVPKVSPGATHQQSASVEGGVGSCSRHAGEGWLGSRLNCSRTTLLDLAAATRSAGAASCKGQVYTVTWQRSNTCCMNQLVLLKRVETGAMHD
jgi:hypothetical protein